MKSRQPKAGARRRSERGPEQEAGAAYAGAIASEEASRFGAHASLADEVLLMRAQVYRLARRIDLDNARSGLKQLRVLTEMVRTIATLERVRLLQCAREAEAGTALARAAALVRPQESL